MAVHPESSPKRVTQLSAVVIGGSAGSLEVVRSMLHALPSSLSIPIVIVIHLPERSPDRLPQFLSIDSVLPVKQAQDKEPLCGGSVYVAPPGYHLMIESHHAFALSVDAPVHYSRPAIDVLFESACDAYADRLLAVLLSGASEDGAAGLQEVAAAGGITIVQSPHTAEVAVMPNAALARFQPTYVWSPAEIAGRLPQLLGGIPLERRRST